MACQSSLWGADARSPGSDQVRCDPCSGCDARFHWRAGVFHDNRRDLFDDPTTLDAQVFAKDGVFPIHSCLAIKGEFLERHPDLAANPYAAFTAAKAPYLAALQPVRQPPKTVNIWPSAGAERGGGVSLCAGQNGPQLCP
ncbi:hypothetical protein BFP70_06035 [Thioclava sp. SK-1]|nr:hypothetical protein BFP70_06035 [Thioclava sp. SK-1]